MKLSLLCLALLLCSGILARSADTTFLKRQVIDTPYPSYHAIFIDTADTHKNPLIHFGFDHYDSATYFELLTRLKPLKKVVMPVSSFPQKWIALYRLKGQYYLYTPSDAGNHFQFEITDSTTIDFTMEGPCPSKLNRISASSSSEIMINRSNYWNQNNVRIRIIDSNKGIAVFQFGPSGFKKKEKYILMVDASKARLFPVIVNWSTEKQPEFDFDEIDFARLLK
ncbi:hypothetical protein [Sediminibacterium ginsengisoli]|uniref:Uncharacterized protein n=1 Tax=Sediminibacterium ginsengisoli TaxID=413434 RepID=A0A1T4M7X0_9BACT|nr:hypothetical protein [Sediminibacterium ginsengisoli]SJZ63011.1 hypothetical protein SAMN04488132_103231 [Sediminibacterium ginsengisoli]